MNALYYYTGSVLCSNCQSEIFRDFIYVVYCRTYCRIYLYVSAVCGYGYVLHSYLSRDWCYWVHGSLLNPVGRKKVFCVLYVCDWGWGAEGLVRERERGVSMNVLHASQDPTVSWEASVPVMTYFILGNAGHHLMTQRVWLRSWRENVNTLDQTSQGFITPGRHLLRFLGKTLKKTFRKNKNHIVLGWV